MEDFTITEEDHRYRIKFSDTHLLLPAVTIYFYKDRMTNNVLELSKNINDLIRTAEERRRARLSVLLADALLYQHQKNNLGEIEMAKKPEVNYNDLYELFLNRTVIVGLKDGVNLTGDVRYFDDEVLVLVTEPKSSLEIETQVVHTVVYQKNVNFVQFKTARE